MDAEDKKNTAGEQFHFSRFNNKLKMKLREGSWVAGRIKTCWMFL